MRYVEEYSISILEITDEEPETFILLSVLTPPFNPLIVKPLRKYRFIFDPIIKFVDQLEIPAYCMIDFHVPAHTIAVQPVIVEDD